MAVLNAEVTAFAKQILRGSIPYLSISYMKCPANLNPHCCDDARSENPTLGLGPLECFNSSEAKASRVIICKFPVKLPFPVHSGLQRASNKFTYSSPSHLRPPLSPVKNGRKTEVVSHRRCHVQLPHLSTPTYLVRG